MSSQRSAFCSAFTFSIFCLRSAGICWKGFFHSPSDSLTVSMAQLWAPHRHRASTCRLRIRQRNRNGVLFGAVRRDFGLLAPATTIPSIPLVELEHVQIGHAFLRHGLAFGVHFACSCRKYGLRRPARLLHPRPNSRNTITVRLRFLSQNHRILKFPR